MTLAKRLRNETDAARVVGQASGGWFKSGRDVGGGRSWVGSCLTAGASAVSPPGQPQSTGGSKPAEARRESASSPRRPSYRAPGRGPELPCLAALLPRLGFQTSGTQNLKPGRGKWDFCMHVRRRRCQICMPFVQPTPPSPITGLQLAGANLCIAWVLHCCIVVVAPSRLAGKAGQCLCLTRTTPLSRPGAKRRQRDCRPSVPASSCVSLVAEAESFVTSSPWSFSQKHQQPLPPAGAKDWASQCLYNSSSSRVDQRATTESSDLISVPDRTLGRNMHSSRWQTDLPNPLCTHRRKALF